MSGAGVVTLSPSGAAGFSGSVPLDWRRWRIAAADAEANVIDCYGFGGTLFHALHEGRHRMLATLGCEAAHVFVRLGPWKEALADEWFRGQVREQPQPGNWLLESVLGMRVSRVASLLREQDIAFMPEVPTPSFSILLGAVQRICDRVGSENAEARWALLAP